MGYALTVYAMAKITDTLGEFDLKKMFQGKSADSTQKRAEVMAALSEGYAMKQKAETGDACEKQEVEYFLSLDPESFAAEFNLAMKAIASGLKREIKAKKQ